MAQQNPGRDAGQHDVPRRQASRQTSRVAIWLTWWVLLMSLWVAADDSLETDELIAGAAAAALAALAAEVVTHQAQIRLRVRAAWLPRALRLPGQVVHDTFVVFGALARALVTGAPVPDGGFGEEPIGYGDDTPAGVTRRVLLIAARSLAPNEFVLGMDPERNVMVVHRLVGR